MAIEDVKIEVLRILNALPVEGELSPFVQALIFLRGDMSVRQLAAISRYSRSTIARIEDGIPVATLDREFIQTYRAIFGFDEEVEEALCERLPVSPRRVVSSHGKQIGWNEEKAAEIRRILETPDAGAEPPPMANALRALREQSGVTRDRLVELLKHKYSKTTIFNLEHGTYGNILNEELIESYQTIFGFDTVTRDFLVLRTAPDAAALAGRWVEMARHCLEETQEQFGAHFGLSQPSIVDIEAGRTTIRRDVAEYVQGILTENNITIPHDMMRTIQSRFRNISLEDIVSATSAETAAGLWVRLGMQLCEENMTQFGARFYLTRQSIGNIVSGDTTIRRDIAEFVQRVMAENDIIIPPDRMREVERRFGNELAFPGTAAGRSEVWRLGAASIVALRSDVDASPQDVATWTGVSEARIASIEQGGAYTEEFLGSFIASIDAQRVALGRDLLSDNEIAPMRTPIRELAATKEYCRTVVHSMTTPLMVAAAARITESSVANALNPANSNLISSAAIDAIAEMLATAGREEEAARFLQITGPHRALLTPVQGPRADYAAARAMTAPADPSLAEAKEYCRNLAAYLGLTREALAVAARTSIDPVNRALNPRNSDPIFIAVAVALEEELGRHVGQGAIDELHRVTGNHISARRYRPRTVTPVGGPLETASPAGVTAVPDTQAEQARLPSTPVHTSVQTPQAPIATPAQAPENQQPKK